MTPASPDVKKSLALMDSTVPAMAVLRSVWHRSSLHWRGRASVTSTTPLENTAVITLRVDDIPKWLTCCMEP